jgi:signal peptidase II
MRSGRTLNEPMIVTFGMRLALFVALATSISCDRVTKHVAATTLAGTPSRSFLADTVRLEYVENTGGFLSLGSDLPPPVRTGIFTIGVGLMLLAVTAAAIGFRLNAWQRLGLALFVVGGASNWVDRVLHGSVIDFMNVGVGALRTGIFNVADVYITLGAAIVVCAELRWDADPADLRALADADHADLPRATDNTEEFDTESVS